MAAMLPTRRAMSSKASRTKVSSRPPIGTGEIAGSLGGRLVSVAGDVISFPCYAICEISQLGVQIRCQWTLKRANPLKSQTDVFSLTPQIFLRGPPGNCEIQELERVM